MNKKDRRITIFLEFFFVLTGLYLVIMQAWELYTGVVPGNLFEFSDGSIPAFDVFAQFFTGLASFIAYWTLWARATWSAGWCMFTLGLLIYHNVHALGPAIHNRPASAIPMIIILLVVMQSFPFLIRNTRRYR